MTYERTLEAYRSLLRANPGHGLVIPGDCVAFLLDSDQLYACQVQDGRPLLAWMFPITAEAWDEDDEAWLCDAGGLETADALNDPQFVPLLVWDRQTLESETVAAVAAKVGTSDQGVAITIERNNEGTFYVIWKATAQGVKRHRLHAGTTDARRLEAHARGFIEQMNQ
ncbi:TPA: hypothetical protein NIJ11_005972 [Pseudomonas aeruginosa]|nr:hypothetical protein [Pseudomonas aeruginosa]